MALLDRVSGVQRPKISPIVMYGMFRELARGEIVKQFIVDELVLDATDETNLDWLITQYQAKTTDIEREMFMQGLLGIMVLSEIRQYPGYETQAEIVAKITSL